MATNPTVSDVNRGPMVIGVSTMMTVFVTVVLCLRCRIRSQRKVKLGVDDGLFFLSFFLLLLSYTIILLEVNYGGLGKPILVNYKAGPEFLVRFLQILFAQEVITPIAITVTKCAVLAMYYRVFPTRFMKRCSIGIGIIAVAWCIGVVFPGVFRCDPVYKAWGPYMLTGSCNSATGDWIAWQDGIPEFVTLVLIFVLPIFEIARLSASLRTQLAISAVFAVGSLSIISSVFRFVLAFRAHQTRATIGGGDATLDTADLLLWAHVEVCTGFLAACLPPLRPLFISLLRSLELFSRDKARLPPGRDIATFGGSGSGGSHTPGSSKRHLHHNGLGMDVTTRYDHSFEDHSEVRGDPGSGMGQEIPLQRISGNRDAGKQRSSYSAAILHTRKSLRRKGPT